MMTTGDEVNNGKKEVRMNLFFTVFRLFVLLPNSMSKLSHNRCTYVYVNEQLAFYVLVRCFVVLNIHL